MINTAEQNFSSVFILDSLNNVQMKVLKKARIKSFKVSSYFKGFYYNFTIYIYIRMKCK